MAMEKIDSSTSSSFRRLGSGRPPLFRGIRRSVSKPETQRKECLNDNILTENAPDDQSSQSSRLSTSKLSSKLKAKMIKKFQTLQRKNTSSATSVADNFSVDTFTPVASADGAVENDTQDTKESAGMFGFYGPPESALEDDSYENLQKQVAKLQLQVSGLNRELDHVYVEKDQAVSKLDKLIDVSKSKSVLDYTGELEELRDHLTLDETFDTQETPVRPFYKRLCFCAGGD